MGKITDCSKSLMERRKRFNPIAKKGLKGIWDITFLNLPSLTTKSQSQHEKDCRRAFKNNSFCPQNAANLEEDANLIFKIGKKSLDADDTRAFVLLKLALTRKAQTEYTNSVVILMHGAKNSTKKNTTELQLIRGCRRNAKFCQLL